MADWDENLILREAELPEEIETVFRQLRNAMGRGYPLDRAWKEAVSNLYRSLPLGSPRRTAIARIAKILSGRKPKLYLATGVMKEEYLEALFLDIIEILEDEWLEDYWEENQ